MFFVLSKTLSILVMPLTLVFICLVVSLFLKNPRRKKIALWSAGLLLFIFSNDFISNSIMRLWEIRTVPYDQLASHELGVVLTGSTLPFLQPEDRVYFGRGADRVTHTVQLYKLGLIKKILISGGSGRLTGYDEPEANKFQKAMIMMGVDSVDIWIENETRNTHESAVEVKTMLDSLGYASSDCLLITSAYHMRRSLACYRKVGLEIQPFTTDFYAHPFRYTPDAFLIPSVDAMENWQRLIKEWVGFVAYKLAGYI